MAGVGPGGLKIAPLWRRALAVLIDLFVFVAPIVGVAAAVGVLYARWRPEKDAQPHRPRSLRLTRAWRIALAIGFAPLEVRGRHSRSPGWRVMGLRYADARTGGPVSVRSAIVRHAIRTVWSEVTSQLLEPWKARAQQRRDATFAEADAARRAHPEDPQARQQAMADAFAHGGAPVARGCAVQLLVTAAIDLPALWSPRHQTLPERIAGVVVVRD